MNHRSKQFLPVLAASLSLLALPVLAQNSGSSGSGANPQPSPSRSDRDQRPGPSDNMRPGSSSTSGSSTSDVDSPRRRGSDMDSRSHTGIHGSINFDQLDSDGDGRISRSEYTQSSFANPGGAAGRSSVSGQAGASGSATTRGSVQGGQDPVESFRKLDTNNDGYLSRDEIKGGQLNRLHGKQQPSQP